MTYDPDRQDPAITSHLTAVEIVRAVETCSGCPSQWDVWTADGRYLYLRYRWGVGTVGTSAGATDRERTIARFDTGRPYDGVISLEQFCERAGLQLADNVQVIR